MKKHFKLILTILFVIGIIGGSSIISKRMQVEKSNNTYQYVVDLKSILSIKSEEKREEVFDTLKENKIDTITVDNVSIKELQAYRDIKYLTVKEYMEEKDEYGYPFRGFIPEYAKKDSIVVVLSKNDFLQSEIDIINEYLGDFDKTENKDNMFYYIDQPMQRKDGEEELLNEILTIRFLLDQKSLNMVKEHGFNTVVGIYNETNTVVQPMLLDQILNAKEVYGVDKMQIRHKQAFGHSKNTYAYMEELKKNDINVVTVEFKTSIGLNPYLEDGSDMVIRGHELGSKELELSASEMSDRIARAVKERNMRVIIVRGFIKATNSDTIDSSLDYLIESLNGANGQLSKGYEIGNAAPYVEIPNNMLGNIFIALAIASLIGLLAISIFEKNTILATTLALLTFVGAIIITKLGIGIGIKLYALGTAIAGAVGAIIIPSKTKLRSISINYILTSLLATLSGLLVASIMYDTEYLVKLNSFSGVKVLYILPPVLVLFWLLSGSGVFRIRFNDKDDMKKHVRHTISGIRNIPWYAYVIIVLVAIGGVVYIQRSGNSGTATELELQIRRFLEDVFYVRPRTKEFILGYPAILMTYYFLKDKVKYGQYMFVVSAIGTMSTVNTFTHLHTPIVYSLLRTFYSIVLGAVVGLVYIFIFKKLRALIVKEEK